MRRVAVVSPALVMFTCCLSAITWAQGPAPAAPPGPFAKAPNLPDSFFSASSTVGRTTLRHEWANIQSGNLQLRAWVEYPDGDARRPVVIVMPSETGVDDWARAVADQLAHTGFIAIVPDILSGLGPRGGNQDAFEFPDGPIKAIPGIGTDEIMRRYRAALDYGLMLPRASGKIAALGIGKGGADAFRFAAEATGLNAVIAFYGGAPDEAAMAKIQAPVLGLYGGHDFVVTPTVERTTSAMKRLGKSYEAQIYPRATQDFLRFTTEGLNRPAAEAAWPKAIAFLQEHLQ